MKNLFVKLIIFLVLLICLGFFLFRSRPQTSKGRLGEVIRQDVLQKVTIAGSITPQKKTLITAPYNSYVKKLYVKVGDSVKVGDPLVSVVQSLQSEDNSFPLRSPLQGTVVQIEKSEGEFARSGDPKDYILRIDDASKFFILATAPEIDRVKVKAGQSAIIKVSAIADRKYKGVLRDLSLAAREKDQWARSQVVEFPVRVEVLDPDERMKSGMSVLVDIITAKREKVLTLRHEFLFREADKYFVLTDSGQRKDIEVGIQNEEGFEVIKGLSEGEKVRQVDFSELFSKGGGAD